VTFLISVPAPTSEELFFSVHGLMNLYFFKAYKIGRRFGPSLSKVHQ
jgi:hypothetical protein